MHSRIKFIDSTFCCILFLFCVFFSVTAVVKLYYYAETCFFKPCEAFCESSRFEVLYKLNACLFYL